MYTLTKEYLKETLRKMKLICEETENYKLKIRYEFIIEKIEEILEDL